MGRPTKSAEPLTERLELKITAADDAALRELSVQRGVSKSDLVRMALGIWLAAARG